MNAELKQGLEGWAEWICDECGIEHDDQLVGRMGATLGVFQNAVLKLFEQSERPAPPRSPRPE